ncbi:hypothetical protein ACNF40_06645 [Cuniculiplasma sp. SKW4]|uniref:hypothetical protein n=1 Tax=Cuniculiplasma sp. SKW4 TaxID=3400171 RepID=UPI003FD5F094
MEEKINLKSIHKVRKNARITFPVKERERYVIKAGSYVKVIINKIVRYVGTAT